MEDKMPKTPEEFKASINTIETKLRYGLFLSEDEQKLVLGSLNVMLSLGVIPDECGELDEEKLARRDTEPCPPPEHV